MGLTLSAMVLLAVGIWTSGPALAQSIGSERADVVEEIAPDLMGEPVVRRILFQRAAIFSDEDKARVPWLPLGLVNTFHVDTRTHVIRRELVFEEGERLNQDLLEESERRLRSSGFFGEADVVLIQAAPDSVDVLVRTREIWTTAVNVKYERFEDQTLWGVQLRERNFLGLAKNFSVSSNEDEDRTTWSVGAGDRQLFDGRWRGRLSFAESSDGTRTFYQLRRPFFRLDSMWGGSGEYFNRGARARYYLSGREYVRPQVKFTGFETWVGRRLAVTDAAVWRGGMGLAVGNQIFSSEENLDVFDVRGETDETFTLPADVPENRKLRIPYLWISSNTKTYGRQRFLNSMGRIEDVPTGLQHYCDVGWAVRLAGATDSGASIRSRHRWAAVSDRWTHTVRANFGTLLTSDGSEDLRLAATATSYRTLAPGWRLALGFSGATSSNLDRDSPYVLGLDTGLRAARFREFAGDRLLRGNAELRWVYTRGLLDLMTPGFAGFFDVGTAWFEDERDLDLAQFRGAIGVGFRFGFNRGSEEAPIRLDLGWPLFYDNGRGGAVLSIGTGQVF